MIKRLKFSYSIYNFFNRKKLIHNAHLYKKYGLKKFYFSPISSKDFRDFRQEESIEKSHSLLKDCSAFSALNASSKESLMNYEENGFAVLDNFFDLNAIEKINYEIEKLLNEGKVKLMSNHKIMFAIHKSEFLRSIGENKNLKELLNGLMGEEVKLFQSINFKTGSEQPTHSDSIHMTTFPLGGLFGVWIALEDIDSDNGPLHYYPGSHKLPYYLNSDYDNEGSFLFLGSKDYTEYEKMIEAKIVEYGMKKTIFTAKAGDVLIWHANLFHGGDPHINKNKTRKSMVLHYFAKNRICYHEITQRPALIEEV